MDSAQQRKFWNRHIQEWSLSAYENGKDLPFIERIAQPWRKHLRWREEMAVEIVSKWAPKSVVELGCGTGGFAAAFLRNSRTIRRYAAFDISESAVATARDRVGRLVLEQNVNVTVDVSSVEDLDSEVFRDFDVLVGLGLIPYLTDTGFEKLAAIAHGKPFLFDYHPREATIFNGIHFVYRNVKGYPFYRMFTEPELAQTMTHFGFSQYELIRRGPLRFLRSLQSVSDGVPRARLRHREFLERR
jgi:SAM-dependent methyltransferase